MDVENIGRFLLKLRKENNLTQKEIATLCSVSAQAVSKWERGVSVPDIELLERLSVLYMISINEIISGEKKTIYIDVEKRRKIVNLTAASLVFLAYLFNFFNGYESSDMQYWSGNYILKGYELIFNGIGGYIVVLSWGVFLILVSYLIIRIYLLVKIIDYSAILHKYLMVTMISLMFITFISLITPEFYAFPQLIILIAIIIQFSNSLRIEFPKSKESELMIKYKEDYKKDVIDNELLLDEKTLNSKLYKYSKISVKIGIVIYFLAAFTILSMQMDAILKPTTIGIEIMIMISTVMLTFALAIYSLKMYKYIGSFNTKKVFIQLGIIFIPILFLISMFMGVGAIYNGIGNVVGIIESVIFIEIFITSCLLFYSAYKI